MIAARSAPWLLMIALAAPSPILPAVEASELDLHLFGDATFQATDEDDGRTFFGMGEVALFAGGRLSGNISGLLETVVEATDEGESEVDVERLILTYRLRDYLSVHVGRVHTPIGYYNTAFHHGQYLEMAASRPMLQRFESDGGILPSHLVGLSLSGDSIRMPGGEWGYEAGLGNGRDTKPTRVQMFTDANSHKAVVAHVTLRPSFLLSLELGVSTYLDRIPRGDPPDALDEDTREEIYAAHVAFDSASWSFIGEYAALRHRGRKTGSTRTSFGTFAQIGRHFGPVTPYARAEAVDTADDAYFALDSVDREERSVQAGARWDFDENAALKLEARADDVKAKPNPRTLAVQLAFIF